MLYACGAIVQGKAWSFNPLGIDTHFTVVLLETIRYTCRDLGFTNPTIILPHIRAPRATSGKKPSVASSGKPFSVEGEEGVKEDPSVDLRQKKRKRKVSKASPEEAALGVDSLWEHEINPIDHAFPTNYNFRAALDTRLTNGPIREILGPLVPEQLLGTAQYLACKLTVGVKNALAAKVQMEKELRLPETRWRCLPPRGTLPWLPLPECQDQISVPGAGACRRKKVESLTQSLKRKQTALGEAEAAAVHWRDKWKSLAKETGEMVQETFEILMDQVRHLNLAIDYSTITLDTDA
ncbi:hypothetical protein PIB30_081378 [Stylosanthes scabra]|uniref:Uncharacterized protein n=1 Tax=Stylosanthes scabra TaxID=79078 RepID=A0ABU6QT43_9FABA|nr:hypothetical protein [Stylosanthes scabra]